MFWKKIVLLFLLMSFSQFVFAGSSKVEFNSLLDKYFDSSGELTLEARNSLKQFNSDLDKVPGVLRNAFLGETITLEVNFSDNSTEFFCVKTTSKIESISRINCSNPSLLVSINESTIKEISSSDNFFDSLVSAYLSGEIKVSPVGVPATLKVTFVNIFSAVFSFFNSLFGRVEVK